MPIEHGQGTDVADVGDDDAVGGLAERRGAPFTDECMQLGRDLILTRDENASAVLVLPVALDLVASTIGLSLPARCSGRLEL